MNTEYVIGGGLIRLSIEPASASTPVDPTLSVALNGILALMGKAYMQGMDRSFHQCARAFAEEFNNYLDDARIGQAEEDPFSDPDPELVEEMEEFMDSVAKKGKK